MSVSRSTAPLPHAHRYRAFGLVVECSFELPELDPAPDNAGEAAIRVDLVANPFPAPAPQSPLGPFPPPVVVLADARFGFRISEGTTIEVWEAEAESREFMRGLLLGIAFTVALYQRGSWPMHVSAVANREDVWLFGGRGGAGKSTLASWLHVHLGFALLTDDAGVIRFDGDTVRFSSGSRAVRLLPDALPYTFDAPQGIAARAHLIPSIDRKVRIRLDTDSSSCEGTVKGLVMLDDASPGDSPRIDHLRGAAALQAIRASMFRPWLGQYMCTASDALRFCGAFQSRVPIHVFARHRDFASMAGQLRPLLNLIGRP